MNLGAYAMIFSSKIIPLVYVIIGFGLLVTVHEFGHFLFCKIFGVYTPTFSIGIGPKLLQKKIGTTNFCISAFPIGGYVEIAGMLEEGQGDQKLANLKGEGSFASKPYWQKIFILSGGVLFNIILAYIIFSFLFFVGVPKQKAEIFINKNIDKTIQEKYHIKPGDQIISINGNILSQDPKKLVPQLHEILIKPLTQKTDSQIKLQIHRKHKTFETTIESLPKNMNENFLTSLKLKTIRIKDEYEKYPLFKAIKKGIITTHNWIYQILYTLKYLITQRTLKGTGGPIMIVSKMFETAQAGFIPLLILLAFISINLAIINILPIIPFDGGQMLFATIEFIFRKEIPEIIRSVINLISWILILSLILYLSYKDISYLFSKSSLMKIKQKTLKVLN